MAVNLGLFFQVAGSFGLLTLVIRISVNIVSLIRGIRDNSDGFFGLRFNPFTRIAVVIEIFLFAWFICGKMQFFLNPRVSLILR